MMEHKERTRRNHINSSLKISTFKMRNHEGYLKQIVLAVLALAFAAAVLCRENPGEGCGVCRSCRNIKNGSYEDLYLTEPESKGAGQTLSIKDEQIENLQVRLKSVPTRGDRNIAIISDSDAPYLFFGKIALGTPASS